MRLPVIDDSGDLDVFDDLDRQISGSVSPISTNIRIPKSAIAGIVGDEFVKMDISKSYFPIICTFHVLNYFAEHFVFHTRVQMYHA